MGFSFRNNYRFSILYMQFFFFSSSVSNTKPLDWFLEENNILS